MSYGFWNAVADHPIATVLIVFLVVAGIVDVIHNLASAIMRRKP